MAWTLLLGASLVEVLMAMALKQSEGWSHAGYGASSTRRAHRFRAWRASP